MCSDPSRSGLRLSAFALGLILPLATAGAVTAQSGPGWVDPPARIAPVDPAPVNPASAAPEAPAAPAPAAQAREAPRSTPAPGEAAAPQPTVAQAERDGGAMAGPSRRAERPRLRRRAARRLADGPPADARTVPPRTARAAAADLRFPDWAARAQELAGDYLAVFSAANGAMVAGAQRFYGQRLRFHGRMTTLSDLLAEKRRFAQRWPERRYASRSIRTACNAALESCIVRAIVDFRAGSPARGALSQGVAELVLEVSFSGGRPVIVSESSRVLRRGATVGALAGGRASG